MKDSAKWDRLLKQALAATEEPEEELNDELKQRWKENNDMGSTPRKRIYAGALVAAFVLVLSVTAVAATQLFNAKDIVEHFGDEVLAEAFASPDAIEINETRTSGGFKVTLHGVVSGAGLTKFNDEVGGIQADRTYAVVSIAREDGSPMPETSDPAYDQVPFFISPLIKGQEPWRVNIASMRGAYSSAVLDGVMYRLIEADGVEMFADRGVYLAVSNTTFYDINAFNYDEVTGEMSPNPEYEGVSVLFDLPLDESKADPEKAEAYLRDLLTVPPNNRNEAEIEDFRARLLSYVEQGTVIPGSDRELKLNEEGKWYYEFDDGQYAERSPEHLPNEDHFSYVVNISGSPDGTYSALHFYTDEDGVLRGRVVLLPEDADLDFLRPHRE
jgi:hypothetical protein